MTSDADAPDAPLPSIDADPERCPAWTPFAGHANPCQAHYPYGAPWVIETGTTVSINTNDGSVTVGTEPPSRIIEPIAGFTVRVVTVERLEVQQGATLRAVGNRPLLILSWSTIGVAGTIDVSSRRGVQVGAGGLRGGCTEGGNGQSGGGNGGGGGGGGFHEAGGPGGGGNAVTGGIMGPSSGAPTIVVAGCRGGRGGANQGMGGRGGAAGGGIQLTARDAITISGTIHAGGEGGEGGGGGGGGGGGSGGYIGLDAPMVTTTSSALLAANGGGGGTGCSDDLGPNGQDGQAGTARATGGTDTDCEDAVTGGDGGAAGTGTGAPGTSSARSGGGGGGGVGYIFVWGTSRDIQGVFSPNATFN